MVVKNITTESVSINKSVQIDVNTMDVNDGYVLAGQTLDLSLSLTPFDLLESEQLKTNIYDGNLVFVISGVELTTSQCIQVYESGFSRYVISQL